MEPAGKPQLGLITFGLENVQHAKKNTNIYIYQLDEITREVYEREIGQRHSECMQFYSVAEFTAREHPVYSGEFCVFYMVW